MRKVCYVTGTRADYGLMQHALQAFATHPSIDLSICVTGMHLLAAFGNTVEEIEADGIRISGRVLVDLSGASGAEMAFAIADELTGFTQTFQDESPDVVVVLGDRGEMLAAAIAAIHLNIPIIHIHGGERSGTVDESVRHAISKLSHYHFVSTIESKNRLTKMGEREDHIFVTGAPGLDKIVGMSAESRETLLPRYGLNSNDEYCLVVFHPVVQESELAGKQMRTLLQALDRDRRNRIVLLPNADAGGTKIRTEIDQYCREHAMPVVTHCPRNDYLSLLANAKVLVGNSSSGIIEAASLGTAVVNVGNRQKARERNQNVIDVSVDETEIANAIAEHWSSAEVQSRENVYGDGEFASRATQLVVTLDLGANLLDKLNTY
ncbi:MAG: UDP-N-acetylglucosamine 2-epimerase [Pseudomonadota bacterium]